MSVSMSGLIYLAGYGQDFLTLQRPHELLRQILPYDVLNLKKYQEWKSLIAAHVKDYLLTGMDETLAKKQFLLKLSEQEMSGSTFFVVKQTNDDTLPETLYVTINRKGFHVVDPATKNILLSHGYSELSFWSSGNTYFHIRFGNMIGASKLLCSTTQGYKIDDLLTSYINYLNNTSNNQ